MPDLYEVLQVHPAADPEVIRAAYRTLARKYHPDLGGDPARMKAINEAWDVLGDPARRAAYDVSRSSPQSRPIAQRQASDATRPGSYAASSAEATQAGPTAGGPSAARPADEVRAGPPPGRPSGTVLDFGRYAGWSLGEIARRDRDYLEWLQRATLGRRLRAEIEALLKQPAGAAGRAAASSEWSRRR